MCLPDVRVVCARPKLTAGAHFTLISGQSSTSDRSAYKHPHARGGREAERLPAMPVWQASTRAGRAA